MLYRVTVRNIHKAMTSENQSVTTKQLEVWRHRIRLQAAVTCRVAVISVGQSSDNVSAIGPLITMNPDRYDGRYWVVLASVGRLSCVVFGC